MDEMTERVETLDRECARFLATYSRESKLRVAKKGIRPVVRAARDILALRIVRTATTAVREAVHPFDEVVLKIAHFPAGSGKGVQITRKVGAPRALIHIGVARDGWLVSQLTSPEPPYTVARGSTLVTLRDLGTVGISAYDLVEQAQRLAHELFLKEAVTQNAAAA
jgi:hypothetical protein